MQSDDDFQTTLSKWPFILGDVLLVSTALAIANLGDWQLTNWQVASCVISVALGAGLFVLPYIVEFKVRVREQSEDRKADLRVLQRQTGSTQDQLEAVSDQIETLESAVSNLAQANSQPVDLTAPLQALEGKMQALEGKIDRKIDPLQEAQTEQGERLAALAALAALAEQDQHLAALAEQDKRLGALAEQVAALAKVVDSKPAVEAIETLQAELQALQTKVEDLPTPVVAAPSKEAADTISPPDKGTEAKARKTRKRRSPEHRLLTRAIGQKQENSSAAVSRIIKSQLKAVKADPETPPSGEVPSGAAAGPEDATDHTVPEHANKRVRTKKSDTAVIASVFIGIGNKPFLRGSAAGLNWESGVALEFEEIGKWRWIAPADLEEPVEVQVFRNDEDPDTTGKHTLMPGQQLQISPVF